MDNFNLKTFLIENKLTYNSQLSEANMTPVNTGVGKNFKGGFKIIYDIPEEEYDRLNDEYDERGGWGVDYHVGGPEHANPEDPDALRPDNPFTEKEIATLEAGGLRDEGYFDKLYTSLEEFAHVLTTEQGGNDEDNLKYIKQLISYGILKLKKI